VSGKQGKFKIAFAGGTKGGQREVVPGADAENGLRCYQLDGGGTPETRGVRVARRL